jgi:amino acid transporter
VSSVALFAIASLIVSFLAFSVVPERLYYQKARERAVRRPFFKKK